MTQYGITEWQFKVFCYWQNNWNQATWKTDLIMKFIFVHFVSFLLIAHNFGCVYYTLVWEIVTMHAKLITLILILDIVSCFFYHRDSVSEGSAVHSVIAACQEGSISWMHPYGALHVTFRPTGYVSGPLTLCFRAHAVFTVAKISLEEGLSQNSLRTLITFNNTRAQMPREHCVQDLRTITLYIEAERDLNTTTVGRFHMEYDVQQSAVENAKDPMEGKWAGLIIGLCPANERQRDKVTPSLIGRAQT